MKIKINYFNFFFILLFLIGVQTVIAQRDSVATITIFHSTKPLQFGNDNVKKQTIIFENRLSNSFQTTEYFKYYDQKYLVYDPVKDPKRLLYNAGLFAGTALVSFGVLWVLPESFTNWDKEEILDYGLFNKWKDNVKAGPVWDKDDFFLNYIMHPWAGGVYYMSARGSGYKIWESFVYSALMSTFMWEYGVEAFAEIPSIQDLIVTPVLGSILGEQFFRWKGNIIRNERKVLNSRFLGATSLFVMDPFNQVLDSFGYKTKHKIQTYSTIAPIDYDFYSNRTIWGLQVLVMF
ncbi:MAG: DUF3943 domain-containing protein [Flavobacteriaceae bacterium]|nr:DUF3943 domain-containing protein [Flavobacteriaceae bacterium]